MIVDISTDDPLGPKVVYTYQKEKIEFTFLFLIKLHVEKWILLPSYMPYFKYTITYISYLKYLLFFIKKKTCLSLLFFKTNFCVVILWFV